MCPPDKDVTGSAIYRCHWVGRAAGGVMTTSPGARAFISFLSCGRSAVVPVIFSRNTFSHPAAVSWRTCPVFVLGGGRDAGIAVNHAAIVHQKSPSKKSNCIKGAGMMQIS
jgi:hypothetical protein